MSEIEHIKLRIKELEEKKELEKMKKKLEELEKPEKQAQSGFLGNIPRIIIPTPGDKKIKENPEKPLFNEKEQAIGRKLKKWGLIIGVSAVAIYCIYRVLVGWVIK